MKKLLVKIFVAVFAVVGLIGAATPRVYANDAICSQPGLTAEMRARMGCSGSDGQFQNVIGNILKAVIGVAGLVAAVYVVIGGVEYMTSTGDSGKLAKAKNTILYALIGLAVCALAFAIVNWAIGAINGSSTNSGGTGTPTSLLDMTENLSLSS